jgi:hypothetical protein
VETEASYTACLEVSEDNRITLLGTKGSGVSTGGGYSNVAGITDTDNLHSLSLSLLLSVAMNVYGASGDLDPAFGNGGKIVTSPVSVADPIHRVRLQPDGKILISTSNSVDFIGVRATPRYIDSIPMDRMTRLSGQAAR